MTSFHARSDAPPTSFAALPPPNGADLLPVSDFQCLDIDMWAFNASSDAPPTSTVPPPSNGPNLLPSSDFQCLDIDMWAFDVPSNMPPTSFTAQSPASPSSHWPDVPRREPPPVPSQGEGSSNAYNATTPHGMP